MSDRDQHISPAALRERVRVMKLRPKEADFKGRKGYERKYRDPKNEAAGYDWKCSFRPNDGHGKGTREFNEVCEMMKPFQRADAERVGSMPVNPALTDQSARSHGRSRVGRSAGRSERGDRGRWCLTTPHAWTPVPEGGNPDGTWR